MTSRSWDEFIQSFRTGAVDPRIAEFNRTRGFLDPLQPVAPEETRTASEHADDIRSALYGFDVTAQTSSRTINTAPARVLNSVSRTPRVDQSLQIVGDNEPVGLPFGRIRTGAKLIMAVNDALNQRLLMLLGWCFAGRGGVEAIERVYINAVDYTAQTTWWEHYTGQPNAANYGVVDPWIQARDPAFVDTGVYSDPQTGNTVADAYSVLGIPYAAPIEGFPQCEAIIKGMRMYDDRVGTASLLNPNTWVESTNPSVLLGNLLYSPEYGVGMDVDWASVSANANINDQLIGGVKRSEMGLFLEVGQPIDQLIEAFRSYAGCFIKVQGNTAYLVPDRPASTSRAVTTDEIADSINIRVAQDASPPSHIRVYYTDQSSEPWTEQYAEYARPGWKTLAISEIRMPGFITHEAAFRFAKDRLTHMLEDTFIVEAEFNALALRDAVGDVLTIDHPVGSLSAYPCRLLRTRMNEPGVWVNQFLTYSPTAYGDDDQSGVSSPIPDLPDPLTPQAPDSAIMLAVVTEKSNGEAEYRFAVFIGPNRWPYAESYDIRIYEDPTGLNTEVFLDNKNAVPYPQDFIFIALPPKTNTEYRLQVITRGPYNSGAAITFDYTTNDLIVPASPPLSLDADQVLDDVLITWVSDGNPNVGGYAIRRGDEFAVPADWDTLDVITDYVDAEFLYDQKPGIDRYKYIIRGVSKQTRTLSPVGTALADQVIMKPISDLNLCGVGDLETWTEGTSFSPGASVEQYVADLFLAFSASAHYTVSRQPARAGGPVTYAMRVQRNSGQTLQTRIIVSFAFEFTDVIALRGSFISVDFWVRTGANYTQAAADRGFHCMLRQSTSEDSWNGLGNANQQTIYAGNEDELPALPSGANDWKRMTGAFNTEIASDSQGLAIGFAYQPNGTAGANDYFEIQEIGIYASPYWDETQNPPYKLPPPFRPLSPSVRNNYVRRLLLYSDTNDSSETPAFYAQRMRATPVKSGSNPWKYDARI